MNNGQSSEDVLKDLTSSEYKYGFTTDVETDIIPKGLNEDVVRLISAKKQEPDWMLQFRLEAYRYWRQQPVPQWGHVKVDPIDYDNISFYAAPRKKAAAGDVDPERTGCPFVHDRGLVRISAWDPADARTERHMDGGIRGSGLRRREKTPSFRLKIKADGCARIFQKKEG